VTTSPVYDTIGRGYVAHRRPDPRWEAVVARHLGLDGGPAPRLVVNVGAGSGSYEPPGPVLAVEPSAVMVAQRHPAAAPAVRASASSLPLPSACAEVAMAILTVHHWDDSAAGLAELCRVAPRRVVLAIDFELHARFWLLEEYLPEVGETTRQVGPGAAEIASAIGATTSVDLPVPRDMQDGVLGAYWCRPDAYLDPAVRATCSGLALADPDVIARGVRCGRTWTAAPGTGATATWPSSTPSTSATACSWPTTRGQSTSRRRTRSSARGRTEGQRGESSAAGDREELTS
jgi:SAM-dependent methyltransferase